MRYKVELMARHDATLRYSLQHKSRYETCLLCMTGLRQKDWEIVRQLRRQSVEEFTRIVNVFDYSFASLEEPFTDDRGLYVPYITQEEAMQFAYKDLTRS